MDRKSAEEMVGMRLRFKDGDFMPYRHLSAHCDDKTACVMVVTQNGQSVLIDDDPNLFPSDALITKLRVLAAEGK